MRIGEIVTDLRIRVIYSFVVYIPFPLDPSFEVVINLLDRGTFRCIKRSPEFENIRSGCRECYSIKVFLSPFRIALSWMDRRLY